MALAGVLSGLRATGDDLKDIRLVIYGAGAAGLGIARQVKSALMQAGLDESEARHRMAILDSRGLIVKSRTGLDAYKQELAWDVDRALKGGLAEVVEQFKPHVLIGSSGQAGAFDERVVRAMAQHTARPIILPFSNPTDRSEATPEALLRWTDGQALVATGSPFGSVRHEGRTVEIGQGNNVFIFPGLGLGAISTGCSRISDALVAAASEALADAVTEDELSRGLLFPDIARLQEVTLAVATHVGDTALQEGSAAHPPQFESWQPVYDTYTAKD